MTTPPAAHHFTQQSTTILVDAPIIALRRDQIHMPGGHTSPREIIEHFGAVAIVAVNEHNEIGLVYQWRQAVGRRLWELPAGLLDIAGEDPATCARRELAEELGCTANRLELLGDIVSSPGFCDEAVRLYLARDLTAVSKPIGEDEEADLTVEFFPVDTVHRMLTDGTIVNGIATAGLYRALDVLAGRASTLPADTPFDLRPTALSHRRGAIVGPGGDMKQPGRENR
ncbi:NUDIX domain-containing protein [Corynebacterium choanae]|uniref:ADP-ribose pyrophosphatase n=1 Tax=Corynebacterium choanae TaxID=1862358 RepID=A0A3G6J9C3_9CORY|nr:NUDIX hydrolase [Corynebacterium choanae]AZA13488.1 ADP-ribose pyrophosphatase [Corynebacterium choanae]